MYRQHPSRISINQEANVIFDEWYRRPGTSERKYSHVTSSPRWIHRAQCEWGTLCSSSLARKWWSAMKIICELFIVQGSLMTLSLLNGDRLESIFSGHPHDCHSRNDNDMLKMNYVTWRVFISDQEPWSPHCTHISYTHRRIVTRPYGWSKTLANPWNCELSSLLLSTCFLQGPLHADQRAFVLLKTGQWGHWLHM